MALTAQAKTLTHGSDDWGTWTPATWNYVARQTAMPLTTRAQCQTATYVSRAKAGRRRTSLRTCTRQPSQWGLVYTDRMGPITPAATGGYKYVTNFTDDYSRMKKMVFKSKKEAAESNPPAQYGGGYSPRPSHPTSAVRQRRRVHLKGVLATLSASTPDGEHCDGIAPAEQRVGADWTDAVNYGWVHSQAQQLPEQQVGRIIQQVATCSSGRNYSFPQNAQQRGGTIFPGRVMSHGRRREELQQDSGGHLLQRDAGAVAVSECPVTQQSLQVVEARFKGN